METKITDYRKKTVGVPPPLHFHCRKKKSASGSNARGPRGPLHATPKPAMKANAHASLIYIRFALIASNIKITHILADAARFRTVLGTVAA